ncbi:MULTISPECIES: hypothetical protein [Bacillus subtilis group]|uniref:hypothetical protein n=1 Tax=Bacillus subtilis group TaxID=653685 RepID=UPI00065530FC|nr:MULTISPECIES: hypothetical protein [Bacillus subtilis group]AKL77794.1 hypothetical protein ABH13_3220 [Bacillus velezensis]TNU62405.1 hypothetical protein FH498_09425 [Bacillus velezensis]WEZ19228.1 hypothetical protein P5661_17885 [Bacillus subtilis]WGD65448.1 hypothetical protein P5652_05315 [Bacillus subtilis]
MADITTQPNPIQRNPLDVATELTQLHIKKFDVTKEDDIANTFAKYFALAAKLNRTSTDTLVKFLPEEIKSILKR